LSPDSKLILLLIALLVGAALLIAVGALLFFRSRRKADTSGDPQVAPAQLVKEFRSSLSILQSKIPGNDYQYRAPWILALGEPSAGKTTILTQLETDSSAFGNDPALSVEWRFLSGGALIDIPGAFFFNNAQRATTDTNWNRFLRLLGRHRPYRPIDGIVLFVPATELKKDGDAENAEREVRAGAIRAKLDHLQNVLAMVVPIYVVVSKCDHIRGFESFHAEINPDRECDLLGWSNPNTLETAFQPTWVDEAFDELRDGLRRLQIRIFADRAVNAADELFLFPLELDRMRGPLRTYLTEIFRETAYVDPNFLRGIYFCGDVTGGSLRLQSGTDSAANSSTVDLVLSQSTVAGFRPRVVFTRDLFDLKVFPESRIARPVGRMRLSRYRALISAQAVLATLVIALGIGTTVGYNRLAYLKEHRFEGLLDILSLRIQEPNAASKPVSVETAYELVDAIGVSDAHGFRALFLPASWRDPINTSVSSALADSFSREILPAFRNALDLKANAQIGNCLSVPAAEQTLPNEVDALARLTVSDDLEYQQLDKSLRDYDALRDAIRRYDFFRGSGRGGFADLNRLFEYLLGRDIEDENRFRHNPYYQRALRQAIGPPVAATENNRLADCVGKMTAARLENFFTSWFEKNNPLPDLTGNVADEIDNLQSGQKVSREDLKNLVDDGRRLDALLASGSFGWLRQTAFNPADFPVLSQRLTAEPFASPDYLAAMNRQGNIAFAKLKETLLAENSDAAGTILNLSGADIHVSAPVLALSTTLNALLSQDFMAEADGTAVPVAKGAAVLWNKASLVRAPQLKDSFDKFVHDRLPLLPSALRSSVYAVAQNGLNASVLQAVARSREPVSGNSNDPSLLQVEIRSFEEAIPVLAQLQSSLAAGTAKPRADLNLMLTQEALSLASRIDTIFQSNTFYAPAAGSLQRWDGSKPLSFTNFSAENAEDIEAYLAREHERIKAIAIDYVEPLTQYLHGHGLPGPPGFEKWPGIIQDVKDYEAKKPGNPIASLESFIRSNLDKITPAEGCQSATGLSRGNDVFALRKASLQSEAGRRCSELLLAAYAEQIAGLFNQRLAGKFPFGPVPATPDVQEADPTDTVQFLQAEEQIGPGLMAYLRKQSNYGDVLEFLQQSEALRQMFAEGLKDGKVFLDSPITFRANRAAEIGGDHIIDWEFQTGDQIAKYSDSVKGLRWAWGSPVRVSLRFAKDSPETPVANPDGKVEGLTVTYEAHDPWALFTLLRNHPGVDADFGASAAKSIGVIRFVIPTTLGGPRTATSQASGKAVVFLRLAVQATGTKEPRQIPIATFPQRAPQISDLHDIASTR
jgi:type VI secretion system protein ImpL